MGLGEGVLHVVRQLIEARRALDRGELLEDDLHAVALQQFRPGVCVCFRPVLDSQPTAQALSHSHAYHTTHVPVQHGDVVERGAVFDAGLAEGLLLGELSEPGQLQQIGQREQRDASVDVHIGPFVSKA